MIVYAMQLRNCWWRSCRTTANAAAAAKVADTNQANYYETLGKNKA